MHNIKVINLSQKNFRYQSTLYKSNDLFVISWTIASLQRNALWGGDWFIHSFHAGSEKKSFHIHNTAVETTFLFNYVL